MGKGRRGEKTETVCTMEPEHDGSDKLRSQSMRHRKTLGDGVDNHSQGRFKSGPLARPKEMNDEAGTLQDGSG